MPAIVKLLEVCVAGVHDALEATAGGADRLELNSALELGGLTPSAGLMAEVIQAVDIPVIAMIRPRAAGFCYSSTELRVILRDIDKLLELGTDGIAVGMLTASGKVAKDACRQFVQLAGARSIVFHRAFDLVKNPDQALDQLAELGFTRVMTSGRAETALAGADRIAQWQREHGEHLEILPAAGVALRMLRNYSREQAATNCTVHFASISATMPCR